MAVAPDIVRRADAFDIDVIAQGVETAEEAATLLAMGVNFLTVLSLCAPAVCAPAVRISPDVSPAAGAATAISCGRSMPLTIGLSVLIVAISP